MQAKIHLRMQETGWAGKQELCLLSSSPDVHASGQTHAACCFLTCVSCTPEIYKSLPCSDCYKLQIFCSCWFYFFPVLKQLLTFLLRYDIKTTQQHPVKSTAFCKIRTKNPPLCAVTLPEFQLASLEEPVHPGLPSRELQCLALPGSCSNEGSAFS